MKENPVDIERGQSQTLDELVKNGEVDIGGVYLNGKFINRGYDSTSTQEIIDRFKQSDEYKNRR